MVIDGFIKPVDDANDLLWENLKKGDALATPREYQMLINMTGVSISAKPRSDGRYQGYVLRNGQKKYLYGKSREEVAVKMKLYFEEEQAPKRKKKEKKNSPLFGEFKDKWLNLYKSPNLKPKSMESIVNSLKHADCLNGKRIDTITTDDIQEVLISIKGTRVRDICRSNLNQIFKKAKSQGIITKNPCDAVEQKKHVYKKKKALTRKEEAIFLSEAAKSKHYLLFRFLLASGLRIGEALALHRSDIDAERGLISVTKDVVFVDGKRVEQETPKTDAGYRTIPVSTTLCVELLEGKEDLIFPATYNAVHNAIDYLSEKSGVKVTPHIIRHTYSTRIEQAKIAPKTRQYLMGHTDSRMTEDVYTDVQEEDIEEAATIIRDLF